MKKIIRLFEYSAAVLLLATALAKFVSSSGHSKILAMSDPIFQLPYRDVFIIVGLVELVVARMCLFDRRSWVRVGSVAWLATHFLLYRLGLIFMHHLAPCPCLGTLTDIIPLDPLVIHQIMQGILAYLALGSYASLIWLFLQRRKSGPSSATPPMSGAAAAT